MAKARVHGALTIAVAAAWMGLDIASARLLREESAAITRMHADSTDTFAIEREFQ